MPNRKIMILGMLLVGILAVSAVSAADDAESNVLGEEADGSLGLEENALGASPGTFSDLANDLANAESELNLTKDYSYNKNSDSAYKNGIVIDKSIAINGNGYTISGNNQARALNIAASNVVLKNIQFTNGHTDDDGGAIYWTGSKGSILYCSFVNCSADMYGGAIEWVENNGTLSKCSFVNCSSYSDGGAIDWLGANGKLYDSSFVNCFAKPDAYEYESASGGAIYWYGTNGTLSNCSFMNCYDNHGYDDYSGGGAVYWYGDNGKLSECSFMNCSSNDGYESECGGGAVYWRGIDGALSNCNFVNCSAEWLGGAVHWRGAHGLVSGCSFVNSSSFCSDMQDCSYGGAIYWSGDNGAVSTCSFVNSSCYSIIDYSDSSLKKDAYSYSGGGAIHWQGNNGAVSSCGFVNSSSYSYSCASRNSDGKSYSYSRGGAINWVGNKGILYYCNFMNSSSNSASGSIYKQGNSFSYGGAVDWYGDNGVLSYCSFLNSTSNSSSLYSQSHSYGGGIYFEGADCSLINPIFEGNAAQNGPDWYSKQTINIINNTILTVINAADVSTTYGVSKNLIVTLKDANNNAISGEQIKIVLNNEEYSLKTNSNGQVSLAIPTNLSPKTYTATITYKGNNRYRSSSASADVVVKKAEITISSSDFSVEYNVDGELVATLINAATGKAISGANVVVNLNGANHTGKTNSKGQVKVSTNGLNPKTYTATISYAGNTKYKAASKTVTVTVNKAKLTITAPKVSAKYNDGSKLVATLTHSVTGKAIVNANVVVNLNGVDYTAKTDSNGQVKVSTNGLTPNTYTATISYAGNTKYKAASKTTNVVVSKATICIYCDDISVTYNDGSVLVATASNNASGKAIGNVKVVVNLNGADYTVKADSKGQITLPVPNNLSPGTYTAAISYAGNAKYNAVTETAEVVVNKATTIISSFDDGDELIVNLTHAVTGKAISGANVVVKIGDNSQTLKTNSKGQVKVSTKELGSTYSATASYAGNAKFNPSSATVNVDQNKITTGISSSYNKETSEIVATLTNTETGKAISGANVVVKINGESFTSKTNSKGQVKVSAEDLNPGTYTVTSSYAGNTKYTATNANEAFFITS